MNNTSNAENRLQLHNTSYTESVKEMQIHSTIIIPNYNGMKYIEKCLISLEGEPAHILVVDNGSTDGSPEFVAEKFPQTKLLRLDRNYGFCGAVNRGITQCKTTYVILLNNDTEVKKGFVRALEKPLQKDTRVFSGSAQMLNLYHPELIDDAGDYYCALGWAFARGKDKPKTGYQDSRKIFAACGGAAIFRREILDDIGLLDENHFAYLEDIDLGYRARIHGYYNVYIPEAVVYHAGSGSSGSRYNEFKVDLTSKNSIYLVYKNMPLLQIFLNLPFLIGGFGIKILFFIKKGYGRNYIRGLWRGIVLCASKEGRAHKVRFKTANLTNYIAVQLELWRNIWYRVRG